MADRGDARGAGRGGRRAASASRRDGALPLTAAEGTLVLAYLLALDAAESGLTSGRPRWARGRLPVLAAGFAAALITAVAAAAAVPASPWLVLAGAAAAGAALLVAAT